MLPAVLDIVEQRRTIERGMGMKQYQGEEPMNVDLTSEVDVDRAKAIQVLGELYNLLEDYGPTWYSEDLHLQAQAALRALREQAPKA